MLGVCGLIASSCRLSFLGGPDGLDGEREPGGEEPVARALHGEEVDPGRGGHPQVRDERDEVVRDRDGLAPGQNGKWLSMHTQYDECGTENMGHYLSFVERSISTSLYIMTDCTWDLSMTFFSPALDVVDGAADVDPAAAPLVALLLGVPGGAGHVVAAVPAARVVAEHVRVLAARVRLLQALVDVLKEGKKFNPQCHAKLFNLPCKTARWRTAGSPADRCTCRSPACSGSGPGRSPRTRRIRQYPAIETN